MRVEIRDQFVPSFDWSSKIFKASFFEIGALHSFGSKYKFHLSLHCLKVRFLLIFSLTNFEIVVQ